MSDIRGNNSDGTHSMYSEMVAKKVLDAHPELLVLYGDLSTFIYVKRETLITMLKEAASEVERDMY